MSDPFQAAAIPSVIAVLSAFKDFNANMGTDPAQWALKLPGALQVFVGTVEMQLPSIAVAEGAALQATINSKVDGWISGLQAKLPPK